MEDTLGERQNCLKAKVSHSLNPCSNGRYSRRETDALTALKIQVLILVLMEDTLGGLGA